MKIKQTIGAAALTTALAIGGGAAAFAGGDGGGGSGTGTGNTGRVAALCAHQDDIVPHLMKRQAHFSERITKLTALQTKASDHGRTKLAERIGKRIVRVQSELDRVTNRIAAAPAWIAEHCS
jgi:hypothetical protein